MKDKISENRIHGFTLIEALVAIAILLIGVLGPMTAATRGITDGFSAGNQLMATYLAKEGIELVAAKIRSNFSSGQDWLYELDSCTTADCGVDVLINSFSACGACESRYDTVSGLYKSYNPSDSNQQGPIFARKIKLKIQSAGSLAVDKEMEVSVTVSWSDKTGSHNVSLIDYVYNPQ